jgi:NADPH:quinone reductase-like Zn-dependent oxidoreductase
MRAVVVRTYGGPEALEVIDVPVPEPARGQVRIRVTAAAVNPVDFATREGLMNAGRPGIISEREHVGIGWDVAGVIDTAGPEVTSFVPGDRVIGLRDRLDQPLGTHAEQVVLDAADVAAAPAGVDDAAVLGYPALDAVRAEGAFAAFIGAGPFPVRGVRVTPVHIYADGAALTGLSALAAAGKLTLRVADTYRLEDAAKAHERLQAGGLRGRLVLVP